VADTTLTITYGDEIVETVTEEDGTFTASIKTVADVTDVTISAPLSYNGKPATETISIKTVKPNTQITIETINLTAGNVATIKATVTASDDSTVTNGKVTFKVNGKTLKDENGKVIYAKVTDGVATAEYLVPTDMNGKDLNITAIYSGSSKFNKSTESIVESVAKAEPTLTVANVTASAGQTINLTATITDGDKQINTGKIVFKINGKTVKDENGKVIYAKVVNGQVSVEYTLPADMKSKDYNITATFISSDYDKLENTAVLTVN
jgi:hypothetical protein